VFGWSRQLFAKVSPEKIPDPFFRSDGAGEAVVAVQVDGRHGGVRNRPVADPNRVRHVGQRRDEQAAVARGQVCDGVGQVVGEQAGTGLDQRRSCGGGAHAQAQIVQRRHRADQVADQRRRITVGLSVQRQQDGIGAVPKPQVPLQAPHGKVNGEHRPLRRRQRKLPERPIVQHSRDGDAKALAGGFTAALQRGERDVRGLRHPHG